MTVQGRWSPLEALGKSLAVQQHDCDIAGCSLVEDLATARRSFLLSSETFSRENFESFLSPDCLESADDTVACCALGWVTGRRTSFCTLVMIACPGGGWLYDIL
jgi:hypothetical protein